MSYLAPRREGGIDSTSTPTKNTWKFRNWLQKLNDFLFPHAFKSLDATNYYQLFPVMQKAKAFTFLARCFASNWMEKVGRLRAGSGTGEITDESVWEKTIILILNLIKTCCCHV